MKLRLKILTLLVPLIMAPMFITAWFAFQQLQDTSEQQAFNKVDTIFGHISEDFQTLQHTSEDNIKLFSSNKLIQEYLLIDEREPEYSVLRQSLSELLRRYQDSYPEYYEIRLIMPDGYEKIRQTKIYIENKTDNESETSYFQNIKNNVGDITTSVFINPDNGKFSLYVAKRIFSHKSQANSTNKEARLLGYLVTTIDLKSFKGHLTNENSIFNGFLFLTNSNNNLIFQTANSPFSNQQIPEEITQHSRNLVTENSFMLLDSKGESYYFKGVMLHPDICLFAGIPYKEFLQSRYQLAFIVAGVTLSTLLVTVILLYIVFNKTIINPIKRLRDAIQEINSGNYIVDIGEINDDEIGDLTRAFAEMGKNIRDFNKKITALAYKDNLTGLPNRHMFQDSLKRLLKQSERNNERLAILYIDIDDFKHINDTLGHQVGDMFLQDVSRRLASILREDDYLTYVDSQPVENNFVARLGGDEFIIILPRLSDSLDAAVVAERLTAELAKPFKINKQEFFVGASTGITIFPDDGKTIDVLIRNADIAMYHAKNLGKNNYKYFSKSMNFDLKRKLSLEGKLRKAIEAGWLTLDYQPIIDVDTNEIVSLEGLCRWEDPELGVISPDEFIPLAEDSGLILPLGKWVIEEACRQNKNWQDQGLPKIPVAINISSIQFDRQDLSSCIANALESSSLEAKYLTIEITESSIIKSPEQTIEVLKHVKELGVNISLDDFGSGYSSLSYLRNFPVDALKIDRDFAQEMAFGNDNATIVSAILIMAQTLNLKVIAEGIQDTKQLDFLKSKKCDQVQGFLFSRPLSSQNIPALLSVPHLKSA